MIMNVFKFGLFYAGLLLSCQKVDNVVQQTFQVTSIQNIFQFEGKDTIVRADTVHFSLYIQDSTSFTTAWPDGSVSKCRGKFIHRSDFVLIEASDCGCWCDCFPFGDCSGHPILGLYIPQEVSNGLNLLFHSPNSAGVPRPRYEKTLFLR